MYEVGNALYIELKGRITPKAAESFMQDILEKTKVVTQDMVVFDFREIQGMNSQILGIVVRVWQNIQSQNKTIRILARPHVAELLRLSRLDEIVDVYLLDERVHTKYTI